MARFIPLLRGGLLYLSKQASLRRWAESSPAARRLTSRFIAGLHLNDAIRAAEAVRSWGALASLDYLGENVTRLEEAERTRDAYLAALEEIQRRRLDSTVSVKVTALGLDISEEACRRNCEALVERAHQVGTLIEFDMEDSRYTDRNLAIVRDLHARYGSVRAVIQAYLYRSDADIEDLCTRRVPVRLCKGAYNEPPEVAFQSKDEVDANFRRLMRRLLKGGEYPAIATHDERMIEEAMEYATGLGLGPERYEFQMLYGVRRGLQQRVVAMGKRLRLYIPYGEAWYPYFMRRLAERPANIGFVLRGLFD